MGVRRGLAAALCVAVAALAGCSDGEASPEPSDPTSAASPTASPSPTGPSIPPEAQGTDEASAKAFVRFWFETLSAAMLSGDVTQVTELSANCVSCSNLARTIQDVYRKGGRFESAGWVVEGSVRAPGYTDRNPDLLLRTRMARRHLFGSEGKVIDTKPMRLVPMRALLERRTGQWRIIKLEDLS
jgi:hypothetical protein